MSGFKIEASNRCELISIGFIRDAQKLLNQSTIIPYEIMNEISMYYNSIPLKYIDIIANMKLKNENDEALELTSIRIIEESRWKIYQQYRSLNDYPPTTASDKHLILSTECKTKDNHLHEKLFKIDLTTNTVDEIEVECMLIYQDVPPSRTVEYTFYENGPWRLSGGSLSGYINYRKSKWKGLKDQIELCRDRLAMRRLLKLGVRNRIWDKYLFPIPQNEIKNWTVPDEYGRGGEFLLPREVHKCRIWNIEKRCYEFVSTHLDGAPNDDELDKCWNDILDKFRAREGRDCIDRMLQQEWGGRGPQHCYCGYCYYYTVYENGKRIVKRRTNTQLERQSL